MKSAMQALSKSRKQLDSSAFVRSVMFTSRLDVTIAESANDVCCGWIITVRG